MPKQQPTRSNPRRASTPTPDRQLPERGEDLDVAVTKVAEVFTMLGLVSGRGRPVCPRCGEDRKGKVVIRERSWKCYPCGEWGSALGLLEEQGWAKSDAINMLVGKPHRTPDGGVTRKVEPVKAKVRSEPEFTATPDPDVYLWLAKQGSREGAAQFYGRWHIAEAAVAELGCVLLPTSEWAGTRRLRELALSTFGQDRLVAAGVASIDTESGELRWPGIGSGYAAMEPHVNTKGQILYYQIRAAGKKEAAVQAHKAGKRAKKAAEAAGLPLPDVPEYVPPFLSLRGATTSMMIGGGVWRLARLTRPTTVVVVEGIKDAAAARTMGAEAYAIPGAKTLPPPKVVQLLARHKVRVALDNDEAGLEGRDQVIAYLREQGVADVAPHELPDGLDVTDVLVSRHATKGCACATCVAWREQH